MRDEDKILDWRSTGRRKARRVLYQAFVEYKCADCGKTTKEPPKDAPSHFNEIWPEEQRFENPHRYYVDLSQKLWDIKKELCVKNAMKSK